MANPPFKVKAVFDYNSAHDDDLNFSDGQIITVTAKEDEDWYVGEYTDASGTIRSGIFPKNYVERYEPAPPPRPVRASRPKPTADAQPPPPEPETQAQREGGHYDEAQEEEKDRELGAAPVAALSASKSLDSENRPSLASSKPVPPSSKSSPPPVAEKPSSFRDRIAAFNKTTAPPPAPFKPSGLGSQGFIKKPFVAPPPSRNAYVPPPREPAPPNIYRRDEDPEIVERQAQHLENAEKAGLVPSHDKTDEIEDEQQPKAVSLKDRIALLQKQQMEDMNKDKPKKPSKKKPDPTETISSPSPPVPARDSPELDREVPDISRKQPKIPRSIETFSDGNEADQSAAGETTEDPDGVSTGQDEEEPFSQHQIANVDEREEDGEAEENQEEEEEEEEEDNTEEDNNEEDEVEEETRHQLALRERMAKLSGGMGMPGMFGAGPLMGIGNAALPKKKKQVERKHEPEDEETVMTPPHRVPMIPMPGISRAGTGDSGKTPALEEEEEYDYENDNLTPAPTSVPTSPPVPQGHSNFGAAPLLPSGKPGDSAARIIPPAPPAAPVRSPSPGSESDDEMPGGSMVQAFETHAPDLTRAPSGKRASRLPPPIPTSTSIPARPPIPPPAATDTKSSKIGADGESEYEGDYDTDIASGAKHKDALKSHPRSPSVDDSLPTDSPIRAPPHPGIALAGITSRPVPPPPPSQPPTRPSTDGKRPVPPPPIPPRELDIDTEDYDPFNYSAPSPMTHTPTLPKVTSIPPLPGNPPPIPARQPASNSDDDAEDQMKEEESYFRAPARPTDLPPPPPPPPPSSLQHDQASTLPQAPPRVSIDRQVPPRASIDRQVPPRASIDRQVPPRASLDRQAPPPPPITSSQSQSPQVGRGSFDQTLPIPRRSADVGRSSIDGGSIARDIDLGANSSWWAQDNLPPPVFRNRSDVYLEIDENQMKQRGGKIIISKDVYVLFHDFSQSVVTARYDAKTPSDVILEQRHEPPPLPLRQDQLEDFWSQYGSKIAEVVITKVSTTAGDGSAQALIVDLVQPLKGALQPIGTRAYGAPVYANFANATLQQSDEIRPGDIVSFRNAKFQGKHGGVMHQKYHLDAGNPEHVAIVVEWDGKKKKIKAIEQGRDGKKAKLESFKLGDLRSGEVRVWRVVGREWVGWGDN